VWVDFGGLDSYIESFPKSRGVFRWS